MDEILDEILESGFDSEVETVEDRDNLSWFIISSSWVIICS